MAEYENAHLNVSYIQSFGLLSMDKMDSRTEYCREFASVLLNYLLIEIAFRSFRGRIEMLQS